MKILKQTFHLIVVLMLIPLAINSQNKYNLNFNDFEPAKEKMPTGWFKWGNFENLTGEILGENNSVGKVVSDKDGTFGCITYRIPANYVGDTIVLSGKIKYKNVKGFVGLLMRIDGNSKKRSLAFKSMQNQKIKGTSDWKEYSIKLPFPSNAKTIFVGGILGKKGIAWFDDFKVSIDGKDIQELKETKKLTLENYNSNELESALSKSSRKLDFSSKETLRNSLDHLIEKIGDKKIIAIGESTHGTSEFYRLREIITKRLIEEKGYNLVVLENPYDDIEVLNKNLNETPLDSLMRKHLFSIYQTQEMKSFLQWYKENKTQYNFKFKGCDDSFWVFYELLEDNINPVNDKTLNKLLQELKSNIAKSSTDNLKKEYKVNNSIYNNILEIENYLESTKKITKSIKEILFNGKNTYINYVNIKNKKPIQSRDEIMADRISFLAKNTDNKIIVWAHNAHISNEIITDNEIGIMGRNLKKEFKSDYYTIGLTTLKGSYSYIDEKFINGDHSYKEELKTESFQPIDSLFWESKLFQNGKSLVIDMSDLKNELTTDEIIGPIRLIGYSKESEEDIYYLPLIKNFDTMIFIKETNSTKPIFE
ncbi:erythromycin esterase family protein [Aequorivita xiaoshiensis]|uniref:Erythromycin esterase family protein n=1 Tax=Aequorivita xiaoshiensis TaxID=2874476 RepID=A0A9X1R2A1_9FLAO|nr:erythromycin esterase family protein [Aequorivita xiaoshiensis]MCG2432198.1 erythromycin esterase family protein [Aequorivita xiaoshiensis]